jgi:hypothetical protein
MWEDSAKCIEEGEGRRMMPVYWHMRSTEPQLSGRRLKHVDGLYGIGAICVRLDGRKRAKARKRRTVGEARTHTHMREVLRLKL